MSSSTLAAGLRQLRGKLAAQQRHEESDEQLLHAFTAHRDDSAFAVLVRRHGPMVLNVCRRVLGHQQDAEDAVQAVFLVLARNAASLRNKASLAGFLHGTAYRTSMKAKQSAARRRKHERQSMPPPPGDPVDELSWREVRALLDEETTRLSEIYRVVFVLFYLEDLPQAEIARRLGLKYATVAKRLAAARKRLEQRLRRRGVELGAVLAAALWARTASAIPAGLMATTTEAALAAAAGEGWAGMVSAPVAALAESRSSVLSYGKSKLAMLLLAMGVLVGSGAWMQIHPTAGERGAPSAADKAKSRPPAAAAVKQDSESASYSGRVLDPDGKPITGAKLYLLYYTPKELPIPVRATSEKDGRFRFTIARKEFDQSYSVRPWDEAFVVATAEGYGIGLPDLKRGERPVFTDLSLRLPKDDVPITGRIFDLQGKPIAGVSINIHGIFWSAKGDLTGWLAELKEKKLGYPTLRTHLSSLEGGWMGRDLGKIFPPVATGADGRFVLRGVGRERVVALRLQKPTIAAVEVFVITRPGDTMRVASWRRGEIGLGMTFCGSAFEHIAAPGQTIVGVVRDKDMGKPLPGAIIRSYSFSRTNGLTHLHAIADKEGRYRLDGMPRGRGNQIRAEGPDGQPYLMSLAEVPKGFALEPVTVNYQLKRGVWVHGKVTDKVTSKPVRCAIQCAVCADNPFRKEALGLKFEDNMWNRAEDGAFRFVTLPGRGVVTARAWPQHYLMKVGADRIKGLDRVELLEPYNTVVEINPAKDAKSVRCDIALERGRSLKGTVLGADGQPLTGAAVAGLGETGEWEREPLRSAAFTVLALRPGETRQLQFAHAEKHLAGSLVIRGDAQGPFTVKLKPAGALKGRFISREGKTLGDLEMFADLYGPLTNPETIKPPDPTFGTFPRLRTDKDGKFRIDNLAPGLKYRIVLHKAFYLLTPDGPAGTGASVKEGETKDLGDVTVKLIE